MSNLVTLNSNLKNLRAEPKGFNTAVVVPDRSELVDRGTEFTTKKFGNDQPGYGSSGLPYIKTAIPPVPYALSTTGPGFPLYAPGTTGNPDYPIRGGAVKFQIGQQTVTLSNEIDRARIKRFLDDPKRGPLFVQKQIGLQLSNPKIETGTTLFGLGGVFGTQTAEGGIPGPAGGLLETTRVYNRGINTLAQVGVQGTGAHAVRHGLVPFNAFQKDYFAVVNKQNVGNEGVTNRLLNLAQLKMITGPLLKNPQNTLDINTVNQLGISLNRNLIYQYLGGPGSTYGIGATTVKRAVDTTSLGVTTKQYASRNAMTYNQLYSQNTQGYSVNDETKTGIYQTQNFSDESPWPDSVDREKRFYYTVPNSPDAQKVDKMNFAYPYVFRTDSDPWSENTDASDDMIKFMFEVIDYDNPGKSLAIPFRAFLEGSITDNNSATWNSFKYLGRGENFYTYQGFDRSVGFSFKVATESGLEQESIYSKVETLVSQVYPDYSNKGNIMRAPLVKLTIGDYIYRMPGFLESVNVTIDGTTTWDTNRLMIGTSNIGRVNFQLPHVLTIQVSFKPIPRYLLERSGVSDAELSRDITSYYEEEGNNYNSEDAFDPAAAKAQKKIMKKFNRLEKKLERQNRRAKRQAERKDRRFENMKRRPVSELQGQRGQMDVYYEEQEKFDIISDFMSGRKIPRPTDINISSFVKTSQTTGPN